MQIEASRVVVTGGAGFIGSHLVERLLQTDNTVTVVDDFSSGDAEYLADHKFDLRLRTVAADVRDEARMREIMRGTDYVFHLATRNVRRSLVSPTDVHEVNTGGTLSVLKAAAEAGVRRLLYCSSSEVNGTADVVPMPEDYHFRPETIYGASKLAGEYYANVFQRAGWLETVIARPHNNYGPREYYAGTKGEVIPRFILWARAGLPLRIYGDGLQTRDFTYVTETADYLVRLLACDAAVGQVFNVCRGEEVSLVELAKLVIELTGGKSTVQFLPSRPCDVLRLYGDPTRLQRTLGESPVIGIRDGLRRMIAWFHEHVPATTETLAALEINTWQTDAREPWLDAVMNRRRRQVA